MRVPKILQTISTQHILTAFYITVGIIICCFLQKDRDTLIEQSLTQIKKSGNA